MRLGAESPCSLYFTSSVKTSFLVNKATLPIDLRNSLRRPLKLSLENTDMHLYQNHNRSAEDKAKELKKLNRSMFAVHVSNPFTASSRAQQADMDVLER